MRYLGNKTRLLDFIDASLADYGVACPRSVADLFAGTGAVAHHFAQKDGVQRVLANDVQYYSALYLKARLGDAECDLEPYNAAEPVEGFITKNYARDRTYFTVDNAMKIDGMRAMMANDNHYAIAALMSAMCMVSNTPGIFQAYLKELQPAALKPIELKPVPHGCNPACVTEVRHGDVLDMQHDYEPVDLVYLDPPYNNRKYSTFYHMLETVARNDDPAIQGICGHRVGDSAVPKVNFYHRRTCQQAFVALLGRLRCKWVAISYSTDGIMTREQMVEALFQTGFGDIKVYSKEYKRYNTGTHHTKSLCELLYVAVKGGARTVVAPEEEAPVLEATPAEPDMMAMLLELKAQVAAMGDPGDKGRALREARGALRAAQGEIARALAALGGGGEQ